ncbi:hypothetical protein AB1Y20_010036 [Prymnesium parvum]|uniref:PIH1 domain-containing protein 2 n=1 Tax=Prymnesium parvum TaxID=97485 RepID=A0AB34K635_PRYPA
MPVGGAALPDGAEIAKHANHLWEFLDEMHERDPEEYAQFLQRQIKGGASGAPQSKVDEIPAASFCVRMRLRSQAPLYVNVCAHSRIESPSKMPDGSVPIAVGVPRPAALPEGAGLAVDVVVNTDVTRHAEKSAHYREEVAALAAQCVKEVLTESKPLAVASGHAKGSLVEAREGARLPEPLAPGYRIISSVKYAGQPQPFVDARQPQRRTEREGSASDEMATIERLVSSMAGGGTRGAAAMPRGAPSPADRALARDERGGHGGLESAGLCLPGDSGATEKKVLVEEIGSQPAERVSPDHELQVGDEVLKLIVKMPRVATAAEVDLDLGASSIVLNVEGLYYLKLELPVPISTADSGCKFDKKRRILTVNMPTASR